MHLFYRIVLFDHCVIEKMQCLVVLCLLSAAVALPTSEQLRTNLPALSPPPELKSEEKNNISDEIVIDPIPSPLELAHEPEEAKNPSESAETSQAEKDEDKNKLNDVTNVIQKESKESKEFQESKEPWESKEFEERPEQPKEQKKEKDSKYEQSTEEDGPIIVQVIQKPSQSNWLPVQLPNNLKPPGWLSYIYDLITSKFGHGQRSIDNGQQDQPIYIVRESDFAYVDRY